MKMKELVCTGCGHTEPAEELIARCPVCGEPLEFPLMTGGTIRQEHGLLARYLDFLPFKDLAGFKSMGEGGTPLVPMDRLAGELGLRSLWLKNESQNPTWSFKDRGTAAGILHAIKSGISQVGTVSTGNMAPSVAAYAARHGLKATILVKAEMAAEKAGPIAIYKPDLIRVQGDYGRLYEESLVIGKRQAIGFINSDVPMRVEGSKTLAFEICEQLEFRMPDLVVVPTSSGGNVRGIEKGFREFMEAGFIDRIPKLIVAQAAQCSPIHNAFKIGEERIARFESKGTIAHAIENPLPPSGNQVLRMLGRNGGFTAAVTEEEILTAQSRLASEGLFGQPASAVPLAALYRLKDEGRLEGVERAVVIFTGSGLKASGVLSRQGWKERTCRLEELSEAIKNGGS